MSRPYFLPFSNGNFIWPLLFFFFLNIISTFGQGLEYTWIAGDSLINQYPNYGQKGVSSPTNKIGSMHSYTSQIDANDNLLVFGGAGYKSVGEEGSLNDLWKWDGTNWTWLSGDSSYNSLGNYGSKGIANSNNMPGARHGAFSWLDSVGNFWLYGGLSDTGFLADLWKWDGVNWTWEAGDSTYVNYPIYGQKGVTGVGNGPGGRRSGACWKDTNDNFWLFGGQLDFRGGQRGQANDLWKWDGTQWTWISGDSIKDQFGIYGTKGIGSGTNKPGARLLPFGWMDDNGEIWLFAGFGSAEAKSGVLNDLWTYNGTNWIWISGSNETNKNGRFGTQNLQSDQNSPPAIAGFAGWVDSIGDFYLHGGINIQKFGTFADVWKWNGSSWFWLKGDSLVNSTSEYGQLGISNANNKIGAFNENRAHVLSNGNVLVFGGRKFFNPFTSNTLWEIKPENNWNGSSWSHGQAPDSNEDAFIKSSSIPGNFQCKNLVLEEGVQFNFSNQEVEVSGDIINNGNGFSGDGKLIFKGQGITQKILGNAISFKGDLEVRSGSTLQTNDSLSLIAESDSVFGQLLLGGILDGNVEIQTWLSLDTNASNGRYFHLGSPIVGAKIEDFNSGGIQQTGQINMAQNSIWEWAANQAIWVSPNSLQDEVSPGKGMAFYAGKNSFGNFLTNTGEAKALAFTGDSLLNSDCILSLEYHSGQGVGSDFSGSGSLAETRGWNMISNPYACHYNWDSLVNNGLPSGIGNAIYTWNGESFSVYTAGGVGINGGSAMIPPFQAFFVQNSSGSTQSLTLKKEFRELGSNVGLFKKAPILDGVKVRVSNKLIPGYNEAWIGFNPGSSADFEIQRDAWKLKGESNAPSVYTAFNGKKMVVNNFPIDTICQKIPLKIDFKNGHGKELEFQFSMDGLFSYQEVWLLDKKNRKFHDLRQAKKLSIFYDSIFGADRWELHFYQQKLGRPKNNEIDGYHIYTEGGLAILKSKNLTLNNRVEVYSVNGQFLDEIKIEKQDQPLFYFETGKVYCLRIITGNKEESILFLR